MTDPIDVPTGARVQVQMPLIPMIAVPPPQPSGVVVLPMLGPPGQDGTLEPEDFAALAEDVAAAVNESLEPPVDLVVWFNNQLL